MSHLLVRCVVLILATMLVTSCAASLYPYRLLDGAPFPASRAGDVHPGMTESEVRGVLGGPFEVLAADEDLVWRYYEHAQPRWCDADTPGAQRPEYSLEFRVFFSGGVVTRTSADGLDGGMSTDRVPE